MECRIEIGSRYRGWGMLLKGSECRGGVELKVDVSQVFPSEIGIGPECVLELGDNFRSGR
jgi:hypothetical protein